MNNNIPAASITGDQFVRTLAQFIRSNEHKITVQQQSATSSSHLLGSRRSEGSLGNGFGIPTFWSFSTALTSSYLKSPTATASTTPTSPISPIDNNASRKILYVTLDLLHLYYLLARFDDLGLDIGVFETIANFDIKDMDCDANDLSLETASISSTNSINSMSSAMSSLSFFSGWQSWTNAARKHENTSIKSEIHYIYKSFTKLTSLKLCSTIDNKRIEGFGTNGGGDGVSWPLNTVLSITMFKNLTYLEIHGLSPKILDGWDIIQEKLEILALTKSPIDDITELFIDLVVDGFKKRKQKTKAEGKKDGNGDGIIVKITDCDNRVDNDNNKGHEDDDDLVSPLKLWKNLRQVNLSDNALTFVPDEPLAYITKCTHIDLSNNLLIAIPYGLSQLYNLQYLDLSNNMIETIAGIYKILGNVMKLNLRNNRIENLCGLDVLYSLEYVDIRENQLTDWAEVTRMTELPGIKQIYVESNPFTTYETNYRINIFKAFKEHGKDIILDGTVPTYNERRYLPSNTKSSSDTSKQETPVAVLSTENLFSSSNNEQQQQQHENSNRLPVAKNKKGQKFHKRVINLDDDDNSLASKIAAGSKYRNYDDDILSDPLPLNLDKKVKSNKGKKKKKDHGETTAKIESPLPKHRVFGVEKVIAAENDPNSKRKRKKLVKKRQSTTPILSSQSSTGKLLTEKLTTSPSHSDSEAVLSPINDVIEYRKRIEELRNEGGTAWLTVFNEMEYNDDSMDGILDSKKKSENPWSPKLQAMTTIPEVTSRLTE